MCNHLVQSSQHDYRSISVTGALVLTFPLIYLQTPDILFKHIHKPMIYLYIADFTLLNSNYKPIQRWNEGYS